MNKPKLLFVYDHKRPDLWMDGLWAALNVLEEDFELICKHNLSNNAGYPDPRQFDFVLGWGAFGSFVDKWLQNPPNEIYKKGLCIAGNTFPPTGADNYDVLFYETKFYRPQINFHKNIVHAFGINSDIFFKSDIVTPIVYDYIGVGALALWKRWDKMKDKKGMRLVVGEFQENNPSESSDIAIELIRNGVMVSNWVSPFDLANLYSYSRTLYMPSSEYGGGERAVLEARACGCQVEIEDDNLKLKELIELDPIPNHHYYAKKLKEGILSVL